MKKLLSIVLTAAILLSAVMPVSALEPPEPYPEKMIPRKDGDVRVQLIARESIDWATNLTPFAGEAVTIEQDKEPREYTLTCPIGSGPYDKGYTQLASLAIVSEFGHFENYIGEFSDPRAVYAPLSWMTATVRNVRYTFNDTITLKHSMVDSFVSLDYPNTAGFVYVGLWDAWFEGHQRIDGVVRVDNGTPVDGGRDFALPGRPVIENISVTFEVHDYNVAIICDGCDEFYQNCICICPFCERPVIKCFFSCYPLEVPLTKPLTRELPPLSISLMAREAIDHVSTDIPFVSQPLIITTGGSYEMTVDTHGYEWLCNLEINATGATFSETPVENAQPAPKEWEKAVVIIESVTTNGVIDLTWTNRLNYLVSKGGPTKGYANFILYDGWWEPFRLQIGVNFTDRPQLTSGFEFGLKNGQPIENITVKFTIAETTSESCPICGDIKCYWDCNSKNEPDEPDEPDEPSVPCDCGDNFCGGDCEDCVDKGEIVIRMIGDVDGDGEITIGDVLEILKYSAGLDSVIDDDEETFYASKISMITMQIEEPTVFDALEILKFLADLENMLEEQLELLRLINADNPLPEDYKLNLRSLWFSNDEFMLDRNAVMPANYMIIDARIGDVNLVPVSAYRDMKWQEDNYRSFYEDLIGQGYSQEEALEITNSRIAPPGASEHNAGLAIDFDMDYENLEESAEFIWLKDNSWKYGFILRYPEDSADITGIAYEPWHYRYVGGYHAKKIYNLGITLEEYLERLVIYKGEST